MLGSLQIGSCTGFFQHDRCGHSQVCLPLLVRMAPMHILIFPQTRPGFTVTHVGPVRIETAYSSTVFAPQAVMSDVAGIHTMVAVHNTPRPSQHPSPQDHSLGLCHRQLRLLFHNQWQPFNRLPSQSGSHEPRLQETSTALGSASHQPGATDRHPNLAVSSTSHAPSLIMPIIPSKVLLALAHTHACARACTRSLARSSIQI